MIYKNKRGQGLFLSIVVGIFIFMIGMLFINFIPGQVDLAQNATQGDVGSPGLNCGGTLDLNGSGGATSDGTKATCLITEAVNPVFIIAILSVVGAVIAGRFLVGGKTAFQ